MNFEDYVEYQDPEELPYFNETEPIKYLAPEYLKNLTSNNAWMHFTCVDHAGHQYNRD